MRADDLVWLLDVDNVLGSVRPRVLRARIRALLHALPQFHHAVAGYAIDGVADDSIASILAESGIAPLRVGREPDAAELALLAHARHVHAEGGRIFRVSSADRKFTELRAVGRVELLVWDEQPVSGRLLDAAHQVRRELRPDNSTSNGTVTDAGVPAVEPEHRLASAPLHRNPRRPGAVRTERLVGALVAGIGVGVGQQLTSAALRFLRGITPRPEVVDRGQRVPRFAVVQHYVYPQVWIDMWIDRTYVRLLRLIGMGYKSDQIPHDALRGLVDVDLVLAVHAEYHCCGDPYGKSRYKSHLTEGRG